MTPTERRHRARRRLRGRAQGRGRSARRRAGGARRRPGRVRDRPATGAWSRLADPEYQRGPAARRPGHRPGPRRPLAAAGGRRPRVPPRDAAATGRRRCCSSPTGCSASPTSSRAGSPSASSSGRWPTETERTWQLLRRAAREAGDWITVDDLAHPYGTGIAAEPYRWAELEQLVYSPSRWERRLIGSTIATMTHGDRRTRPRSGARRRRPAPPRPAHGRRRAGRPEGARVGLSLAGRSVDMPRPRPPRSASEADLAVAHGRRPSSVGHPRHPRQARSGRRRRAARPPGRHPQARRRPIDLRRRPRPPPASAALPDPAIHPEPPLA